MLSIARRLTLLAAPAGLSLILIGCGTIVRPDAAQQALLNAAAVRAAEMIEPRPVNLPRVCSQKMARHVPAVDEEVWVGQAAWEQNADRQDERTAFCAKFFTENLGGARE